MHMTLFYHLDFQYLLMILHKARMIHIILSYYIYNLCRFQKSLPQNFKAIEISFSCANLSYLFQLFPSLYLEMRIAHHPILYFVSILVLPLKRFIWIILSTLATSFFSLYVLFSYNISLIILICFVIFNFWFCFLILIFRFVLKAKNFLDFAEIFFPGFAI